MSDSPQDLIPIHLLEAFVEVQRHGSVTAAAHALHRSQPAISYRIRQLEDLSDSQLFDRSSQRWTLTPHGQALLSEAQAILARCRGLNDLLHSDTEEPTGRVTIGTLPTVARHYLPDILAEMIRDYPRVKWCVRTGLLNSMTEDLRSGQIDVLYMIGDIAVQDLDVVDIEPISLVYVVSPELHLGDEAPTVEALAGHRLMLWRGNDPTFSLVARHMASLGLANSTTCEIPDIDTLKGLARRSAGFTILPDYVCREDVERGTLRTWPIEGLELSLSLRQYLVQGRFRSVALQRLCDRLTD